MLYRVKLCKKDYFVSNNQLCDKLKCTIGINRTHALSKWPYIISTFYYFIISLHFTAKSDFDVINGYSKLYMYTLKKEKAEQINKQIYKKMDLKKSKLLYVKHSPSLTF